MIILTLEQCKKRMSKSGYELFSRHKLEVDGIVLHNVSNAEEFGFSKIEVSQYEISPSPEPVDGRLEIRTDVTGDEQESGFMNACLSIHGETAVSIAVRMPDAAVELNQIEIVHKLCDDLSSLREKGYEITVQIGRNQ